MNIKDFLLRVAGSEWAVALRPNQGEGKIFEKDVQLFTLLENTKRYWCADPFIVESEEGAFIFFEAFDRLRRRGLIGYRRIEGDGVGKINIIIRESFHLSYPCIYRQGKTWYMIPETRDANRIIRYRAIRFPDKWEKDTILIDNIKAVDSTVLLSSDSDLTLFVYLWVSFDKGELQVINLKPERREITLLGSVKDERGLMRPAGNLFFIKDVLIRPSQICIKRYGEGILFNKVLCKEGSYTEEEFKRLTIDDIALTKNVELKGVHTYNHSKNWEVIDVEIGGISLIRMVDLVSRLYRYIKKRIFAVCFDEA